MSPILDEGDTVHVRVVEVHRKQTRLTDKLVIEFEVLDEGPYLGQHLLGTPERKLGDWYGIILGVGSTLRGPTVPNMRILNHSCRAVIGISGRLRQRYVVENVLPA